MDFLKHLEKYLNKEEIELLNDSFKDESKHALLLNTNKMSEEKLLSFYPHLIKHPVVPNGYIYDKNEYDLGKSIFHELGVFYLQEPSAMVVSHLLNINYGDVILDLCAAPGGKSIQASYKLNESGLVVSNDISLPRAKIIKENIERLGIGNILVICQDFARIYPKFKEKFDAIILDAPCSGSGMFRKDIAMQNDWSINKVLKFAELQKELILYAYTMLKPGGELIYSTCSYSLEEDEEVAMHLLKNTDAIYLPFENNPLFYVSKIELGIHLFPYLFPGEGHYIVKFKKPGERTINKSVIHNNHEKYLLEDYKNKIVHQYGDTIYLSNMEFDTKGMNVIRDGVKLGDRLPDGFKYDIHFAHHVKDFPLILEINFEQTIKYIEGQSLDIPYQKGFVLLRYEGVNIDIAKSDGRIIKNRYPKYLRKKSKL